MFFFGLRLMRVGTDHVDFQKSESSKILGGMETTKSSKGSPNFGQEQHQTPSTRGSLHHMAGRRETLRL